MEKTTTLQLEIKVPLEINLDSLDGITSEDIVKQLKYQLSNWSDGRYPFDVELFTRGLHKLLKSAIEDSIEINQYKKHQNEYIHTENSSIAKCCVITEKLAKKIRFYFDSEKWSINICPS